MGYSVELHFDKDSEEIIKNYWKILYDGKGGEFMYLHGKKPHISLALYYAEMEYIDKLKELVVSNFENLEKFKLQFTSVGVFPGNDRVTFLNPKPSFKLLNIHSKLYNDIRKHKIKKYYWGHYKPKIWTPHCTMIVNEDIETNSVGIDLLTKIFEPFEATVEKVALVEFYPYKCLLEMELL